MPVDFDNDIASLIVIVSSSYFTWISVFYPIYGKYKKMNFYL